MSRLKMTVTVETWAYHAPFRIAGYTRDSSEVIVVSLEQGGHVGRAEAAGVRYHGENARSIAQQAESLRAAIEAGMDRETLRQTLHAGGARNAIDCALWDLEAKTSAQAVWRAAELNEPRPLLTVFTCGAEEPGAMAAAARAFSDARALKLKLTGDPIDVERVRAVREARPDVWLSVDANQGLKSRHDLDRLMPVLLDCGVALIEQPFPAGQDALLDGLESSIPLAADESVQGLADIPALVGRYQVINIKLDKCGGLTEGLAMAHAARALGLRVMVGNMVGTSLAMAPAFVLGQLCDVVDLDGPTFLKSDRSLTVRYADGHITVPAELWGHP